MDKSTLDKIVNTMDSSMKLAANLSEKKPVVIQKEIPRNSDDSNKNASSQNIQIQVDSGKKKEPKPIEKHIHEFPENRPLTETECELALKKAQMDYELKKSQQQYDQFVDKRNWEHQLEVEKRNAKKGKWRYILAGLFGTACIGTVGYSIWADYHNSKRGVSSPRLPEPPAATVEIKAEGKVE